MRLLFKKRERERDALLLASNNAHTLRKGEHTHAEREWYIHTSFVSEEEKI